MKRDLGRWGADPKTIKRERETQTVTSGRMATVKNENLDSKGQGFLSEKDVKEEYMETPASVGVSISIGRNAEFGRQKYDVTAWCTLHCSPDRESREDAYVACREEVIRQLQDLEDATIDAFRLDRSELLK